MDPLTGLHVTIAGLLGLAGAGKLARPLPAALALAKLGLPVAPWVVRTLGAAELALAAGALGAPGGMAARTVWAAVAVAYACFAVVGAAMWRSGQVVSCGCFGGATSPPGAVHVAVSAAGVAIAGRGAALAGAGPLQLLGAPPPGDPAAVVGAVFAGGVLALGAVYVLLVGLPPLTAELRAAVEVRKGGR